MSVPIGTAEGTAGRPGDGPVVLIAHGPGGPAELAADLLVAWLAGAVGLRDVAHVALTGGSSAAGLYRALREPTRARALDWGRVHAWFGDDRFVPLGDPDSNAGLALRELVAGGAGPLPADNFHPIPMEWAPPAAAGGAGAAAADPATGAEVRAGADPATGAEVRAGVDPAAGAAVRAAADAAAQEYAAELLVWVPSHAGLPVFDVLLAGVGGDGHVLSVFPDSPALADDAPLVMGIPAPTHITPHLPRVTLSPAVLGAARHVMMIVAGAGKGAILGSIFGPEHDSARWPAQLALRPNATWILDPASAAGLPRK